ncbi:MAG: V-type ATPase subunit [Oscillospiraceae bacterium]|nr:V-type ATPase subunit [Oscillospiraceae bacterium]
MPKPLKDTDFLNATMRVRAMERELLNGERMGRMLEARTHEEAAKVLCECGYGEMTAVTAAEWERVIAGLRGEIYKTAAGMTDRPELVDVFRLRYDYHNVKTLIKAEAAIESAADAAAAAERLLTGAGRVPPRLLVEIMRDQRYNELPGALRRAAPDARETLSRTGDPQISDFMLDAACAAEMSGMAEASGSGFLQAYVRLFIDAYNLRAVTRTLRLGREPDFLRSVLAGGGNIAPSRIAAAVTSGSPIEDIYAATPLQEAAAAGVAAARGEAPLTAFERLADDALIKQLAGAKRVAFGEQPIVAYIAARETEFTAVRIILAGRLAGLPADALRERLRESYAL